MEKLKINKKTELGFYIKDKKIMDEDDAHDEANMIKAKLRVNPETGKIESPNGSYGWDKHSPTFEDYNHALATIERLKQAAKDEPTYKKVAAQILRVAARPVQEIFHSLDIASIASAGPKTGERIKISNWHKERLQAFEDAEKRLRDMQKLGELHGKEDSKFLKK